MKDQSLKKNIILLGIAAALLAIALNIGSVGNGLFHLLGLVMPIIIGIVIAFVLNVPMKCFESLFDKYNKKAKKSIPANVVNMISMWLAIITVILVIVLVCVLVIPEIISSLIGLYKQIESLMPSAIDFVSRHIQQQEWIGQFLNIEWIQQQLTSDKITSFISGFSIGTLDIMGKVFSFISATAGNIISITTSIIMGIYFLLSKKKIGRQFKKLLYAYCNKSIADKTCYVGNLINKTYAKFLSGQFIEAFIIAILLFIGFSIARLPYASLIAVLAAVLSFIPYIGSLLACVIGALLILLTSPWKALLSVIIFQLIQFLEGQFIYPHVVGSSVGLPAVYTLLAALLGASLFGLIGIIFFIPFFSVIYTLLKDCSDARLAKKEINIDDIQPK